jgi:hypothetical protein
MQQDSPLYGVRGAKAQPWRAAAFVILAATAAVGCSDDPHLRNVVATQDPCAITSGQLPPVSCQSSVSADASQTLSVSACKLAPACGDPGTCLPLARNQGKSTMDFRVRHLNILAPLAFTQGPVQSALVQDRVDLNAKQCGERGTGLWNWLLRVDRETGTLTTGGAPPADPMAEGYCFANFVPRTGAPVATARSGISWTRTAFTSTEKVDVRLPVFQTADPHSAMVLPIHDVQFADVSLATEDCIGGFNPAALDSACENAFGQDKWKTGGSLGGYMTLVEADDILLPDLSGESLCVVLTGARDAATGRCTRNAENKVPAMGDYCSTTKSAGGCKDSVWFAATFAASAVKIHDGAGVAACSGAQM